MVSPPPCSSFFLSVAIVPAWGLSLANIHFPYSTMGRFSLWCFKKVKNWSSVCPEGPIEQPAWGLYFLPSSLFSVLWDHPSSPSLATGHNKLTCPHNNMFNIVSSGSLSTLCLTGATFWSCLEEHIWTIFSHRHGSYLLSSTSRKVDLFHLTGTSVRF